MRKNRGSNAWIRFISDLVDFGPIVATVTAAIFFSIQANNPSLPPNQILQWMLLLLTFLATTMLVDRFRFLRRLEGKVTELEETVKTLKMGEVSISDEIPDLRERVKGARSIYLSGMTLNRTSMEYRGILRERANAGALIKVLLMNPDNECLLETSAVTAQQPFGKTNFKSDILKACDNFRMIFSGAKTRKGSGARFLNYRPSYGIWLLDEGTDQAEAWVEIYPYQDFTFPTLYLSPSRNKKWFDFFRSQFDMMWNDSSSATRIHKE